MSYYVFRFKHDYRRSTAAMVTYNESESNWGEENVVAKQAAQIKRTRVMVTDDWEHACGGGCDGAALAKKHNARSAVRAGELGMVASTTEQYMEVNVARSIVLCGNMMLICGKDGFYWSASNLMNSLDLASIRSLTRWNTHRSRFGYMSGLLRKSKNSRHEFYARNLWPCRERQCDVVLGPLDEIEDETQTFSEIYVKKERCCPFCGTTRQEEVPFEELEESLLPLEPADIFRDVCDEGEMLSLLRHNSSGGGTL